MIVAIELDGYGQKTVQHFAFLKFNFVFRRNREKCRIKSQSRFADL